MARRLFRGRAFSENGWPYVDQGSCTWIKVPGAEHVSLQIQNGPPLQILRAFAADYHAYVEPLRDPDSACWTPDNKVATSNHPGGTSMDLNWNGPDGRTFRYGITKERAFPGAMSRALDELYDFYEDIVFCGGEWSIADWMHHQLRAGTYDQKNDRPTEKVNDFIRRKIRADGFSTFNRGGDAPPPAVGGNAVDVLARATGLSPARATEILPTVLAGLKLSDCTNANRIAMWLAQIGHESASFFYTEEIAKNGRYAPYIGRTWIQITWDYNYRAFSKWCFDRGLVSTADYFVANYRQLADLKWAGIGPAWYWTVARPQINSLSDARNLVAVTQAINGGQNGAADRRARYERASALGNQLLTLTQSEPPTDELEALMATEVESWSIYANPGEPKIPVSDLIRAIDAKIHRDLTDEDAKAGDPEAIRRVARTAAGLGKVRTPGAISHAIAVLNQINSQAIIAATPGRAS